LAAVVSPLLFRAMMYFDVTSHI